ncbi:MULTISPECIES: GNAT family N-acetyltransferase [Ornithinibacillus]|uniref:GNAT family N-acetyltransferase n=2 Tax=Ornithinibacillus TaxID=484508 RepID=A0A923L658_9BACI|nr:MULTISPECIES: GNAT family N-acetyltransferase [Ornithinibacillus]MBC5637136.1 GNAT family N-acetyltransferase [Ornithinibacillus hominis]MBS3679653.1 GNAT family N-acetyltransferase [Ornithinibacillus massiliensis]
MTYNDQVKTITTKRLLLRLFQESDADTVAKLCNNYEIYKNTMYLPFPYERDHALVWMERHLENFLADKAYEFAITDRKTGELFGAIALSNSPSFHHGELAYWIGEEYWGNGYATEAAEAMIEFAFKEKQLHKVFARFFSTNPASGRVMEKIGMEKEGMLKEHVRKENRYVDLVYYGIINK